MEIRNYVRAKSLEEAWQLNQNPKNRILGGMLWLRLGDKNINTAIDLCELGLNQIEETEEEFSIGAMVTLRTLELHESFNRYTQGAMKSSVKDIVGVQFRNMATIGGSIWGRFGFSDVLTFFLTLDCYVELYHGGIIPMEAFVAMNYNSDVLIRVIVKKRPGKYVYTSMRNQRTDFPVLACGVSCIEGEYRISVGARPAKAILLRDERGILSNGICEEAARQFADYAAETVPTSGNLRGSKEYRTHLVRVLTERALIELGGM